MGERDSGKIRLVKADWQIKFNETKRLVKFI